MSPTPAARDAPHSGSTQTDLARQIAGTGDSPSSAPYNYLYLSGEHLLSWPETAAQQPDLVDRPKLVTEVLKTVVLLW